MALRNPLVVVSGQLQELPAGDTVNGPTLLGNSTPTSTATLTALSQAVFADTTAAVFALNLPTAVGNSGVVFYIKLIGVNQVTLSPVSGQFIDGSASAVIKVIYTALTLCSNGANWFVI